MYTSDVLNQVKTLRSEISAIRELNERHVRQDDRAPLASRAHKDRRARLEEIVRELSAIVKEEHP